MTLNTGRSWALLPFLFSLFFSGCALVGTTGLTEPVRDCGILCIKHVAEMESWDDATVERIDTVRHRQEDVRGYSALELTAILRYLGADVGMETLTEEKLWQAVVDGARPMLLVQDDFHARTFPDEYHWVVVEGVDEKRGRYRVYLADRSGSSGWWSRRQMERYHQRGEATAIVARGAEFMPVSARAAAAELP